LADKLTKLSFHAAKQGEIVAESQHFGAHLGLVDQSFMMLLFKLQTVDGHLQPAFDKMPTRFKTKPTNDNNNAAGAIPLFFQLLVDFVGKACRIRFLEVLDHLIAAMAPEESTRKKRRRHIH
jgi:hypothetical protein